MSEIIYENGNLTVTKKTLKKGSSVYQIDKISKIRDWNNKAYIETSGSPWKGVGLIILGFLFYELTIYIPIILGLIGGWMAYSGWNPDMSKVRYYLDIEFIDDRKLSIENTNIEPIKKIKAAIEIAMES